MDFDEFKNQLAEDLKDRLGNVEVDFHDVSKVNFQYEAITVRPENDKVGVNLNVDLLYKNYQDSHEYTSVLDVAATTVEKGLAQRPEVDVSALSDYEAIQNWRGCIRTVLHSNAGYICC